jgi:hypothetical protein
VFLVEESYTLMNFLLMMVMWLCIELCLERLL